jgi:hypothetical protein
MFFNRHQAMDALGVSQKDFRKLTANPKFPKPVSGQVPDEIYDAKAIAAFRQRLKRAAAKGWKIPDALFPWDPDFEGTYDRRKTWEA